MIVACVRTGNKYPFHYVTRLQAMVEKHLPVEHRFMCLSDQPFHHDKISYVGIKHHKLPGWWGKMALFARRWRAGHDVIYFDLDTVIVGDLSPLAEVASTHPALGICENFTKLAGHPSWPCSFGSCVMTIQEDTCGYIWTRFAVDPFDMMNKVGRFGDQLAIEHLSAYRDIKLLQRATPKRFFLGRRDLGQHSKKPPQGVSVVVFGGSVTPANCRLDWVKKAWEG